MNIFGICPICKFETEINNIHASYLMCQHCKEIYNINENAKIQGIKVSEGRKEEIIKEIENKANSVVSNWSVD